MSHGFRSPQAYIRDVFDGFLAIVTSYTQTVCLTSVFLALMALYYSDVKSHDWRLSVMKIYCSQLLSLLCERLEILLQIFANIFTSSYSLKIIFFVKFR